MTKQMKEMRGIEKGDCRWFGEELEGELDYGEWILVKEECERKR